MSYNSKSCNNSCSCVGCSTICPPGPIGPKGDTGATGPTGPAPVIANSFAYIINTAKFIATEFNQPVPLDTNLVIKGDNIIHDVNSPDIHLAANHCYLVNWSAQQYTTIDVSPLTYFDVQLLLNDKPVEGSRVYQMINTTWTYFTATHNGRSSIICTTLPSILQITNPTGSFLQNGTFPESTVDDPNISITIIEIF